MNFSCGTNMSNGESSLHNSKKRKMNEPVVSSYFSRWKRAKPEPPANNAVPAVSSGLSSIIASDISCGRTDLKPFTSAPSISSYVATGCESNGVDGVAGFARNNTLFSQLTPVSTLFKEQESTSSSSSSAMPSNPIKKDDPPCSQRLTNSYPLAGSSNDLLEKLLDDSMSYQSSAVPESLSQPPQKADTEMHKLTSDNVLTLLSPEQELVFISFFLSFFLLFSFLYLFQLFLFIYLFVTILMEITTRYTFYSYYNCQIGISCIYCIFGYSCYLQTLFY